MAWSETDLAYAAGLIDGEGCISTSVTLNRMPRVALVVAMTEPSAILWLHGIFGGGLTHERGSNPRCKPQIRWRCSTTKVEEVLRAILPFMKTKRAVAEKALAIRELIRISKQSRRGRDNRDRNLRPELREAGFALRNEIKLLNRRGVA